MRVAFVHQGQIVDISRLSSTITSRSSRIALVGFPRKVTINNAKPAVTDSAPNAHRSMNDANQKPSGQPPPVAFVGVNDFEDPVRLGQDRRKSARFALGLAVKCRFADQRPDRTLLGEVVNISSKGLLFRANEEVPLSGRKITAFIEWPAHLNNRVNLQLVIEGHVVRQTRDGTAIGIERYEFRTRGAAKAAVGIRR